MMENDIDRFSGNGVINIRKQHILNPITDPFPEKSSFVIQKRPSKTRIGRFKNSDTEIAPPVMGKDIETGSSSNAAN